MTSMRCTCGGELAVAVGEETIQTLEGEKIEFRRRSDWVICRDCLVAYQAKDLRRFEGMQLQDAAAYFAELYDEDGSADVDQ